MNVGVGSGAGGAVISLQRKPVEGLSQRFQRGLQMETLQLGPQDYVRAWLARA